MLLKKQETDFKLIKVKTKGATPSIMSLRQGEIDVDAIKIIGYTRSSKALIKGDMGGRVIFRDNN